jgi:hypothetical protein
MKQSHQNEFSQPVRVRLSLLYPQNVVPPRNDTI